MRWEVLVTGVELDLDIRPLDELGPAPVEIRSSIRFRLHDDEAHGKKNLAPLREEDLVALGHACLRIGLRLPQTQILSHLEWQLVLVPLAHTEAVEKIRECQRSLDRASELVA